MTIFKHIRMLFFMLFPAGLAAAAAAPAGDWIAEARACQQSGAWTVADKTGKIVLIEGELVAPTNHRVISSEEALQHIAALVADCFQVPHEDFVSRPEVWLYSTIRELYHGKSYRDIVYDNVIKGIVESQQGDELTYVFTVCEQRSDADKLLLGSAIFHINKKLDYRTICLDMLAVRPEAQGRSLSTILVSSIFNFLPQIKRITLDTGFNNYKAQAAYDAMGFVRYERQLDDLGCFGRILASYEVAYEYLADKNTKLQTVAATLQAV